MNNGKIRIYELSKELNLENKDILTICEQLNISVKSHSSTISESEVERIRAAAKRYKAGSPGGKSLPQSKGPDSNSSGLRPKGPHKPQIREILKHSPLSARNGDGQELEMKADLIPPPQRPSESRPIAVGAPLPSRPKQAERQPGPGSQAPNKPRPQEKNAPPGPSPRLTEGNKPSRPETAVVRKGKKVEAGAPEGKVSLPKGARGPRLEETGVATALKPERLNKPLHPRSTEAIELLETGTEDIQEIVEEEEFTGDSLEKLTLKPKRLIAARPGKHKEWEEEEEEVDGSKGKGVKAVKGAAKTKRRSAQTILVDEEDEELEEVLDHLVAPAAVSLSIARPPKPNQAKSPSVVAAPAKTKKGAAKPDKERRREAAQKNWRDRPAEEERPETIFLPENLNIRELAERSHIPETDIIKQLFFKGIVVNITQTLDLETARLVVEELGIKVETEEVQAAATKTEMIDESDKAHLHRRPPVVTIMGHVDHGKTTLLDSIRKTKVAQSEAGGITQHIGAYHVDVEREGVTQQIVFLDTPGHEAFTAMRARGAKVTDIAVLVVAADDGVQPQTKEAISHARAAGVPIVVAINKIDKPESEPDRIKQELTELELVPEEWGGETIMVPVSAIKGDNLDTLLEMLLLVAEVEELSANPDRLAKGTTIEANLDKSRGPVATLLVQNGTLRVGDSIVVGSSFGKIRAMIDDRGQRVEEASPSFAVEVLGLNDVPAAGDEFDVYENEKEARAIADQRSQLKRENRLQQAWSSRRVTLSTLSAQAMEGELKELNIILKADVQGSLEAIINALNQLPQKEVQLRILLASPGEITETDVALAAASGAVVVGFNTNLAPGAASAADQEGVDIREYDIIYNLLDDIQGAMEGLLDPEEVEETLGQAEVRAVFPIGKGSVAGCYVQSGKVVRNRRIRVRRGGELLYDGAIDSLKRMKDDAKEVNFGYECGIGAAKFNSWQVGDIIEAYQMVMKRRTLSAK